MKALLAILFVFTACDQSFGQAGDTPGDAGHRVLIRDTTRILMEDLFGRFRATGAGTLDFNHNYYTSESSGSTSTHESNTTSLSAATGNRETFQLSGSIANTSPQPTSQAYDASVSYRTSAGLQAGGGFHAEQVFKQAGTGTYWIFGNLGYLTDGALQYRSENFAYYYYFSEKILDLGSSLATAAPVYYSSRSSAITGAGLFKSVMVPFQLVYGFSEFTSLALAGNYQNFKSENSLVYLTSPDQHRVNLLDQHTGDQESLEAKVSHLLSEHVLLSANVMWAGSHLDENSSQEGIPGLPPPVSYGNDQEYYVTSVMIASLWLQQPVTVMDLRRSPYNGRYLRDKEAKNQLRLNYNSHDSPNSESARIADDVSYGFGDHLQIGGGASLAWDRTDAYDPGKGWNYTIGFTFHNLNFSGPELNEIEFFWGRICQPGDYAASLNWETEKEVGSTTPRTRTVSTNVQLGIVSRVDVQVGYLYSLEDGFLTLRGSQIDWFARWDIGHSLRARIDGTWNFGTVTRIGDTSGGYDGTNRGRGVGFTIQAML